MRSILLSMATFFSLTSFGQLVIDNATFFIGEGAVVTVQGNLTTNVAIQAGGAGATLGKIQLKGTSQQQINTNGFVIPRLEMDNTTNAILTGDVKVGNTLELTNGKIQLANFNFILEEATQVVGAGASKFLETNGTGQARRLTGANVADKIIPVGSGTAYTPFKYTTTGAAYGAGAYVGVMATGMAVPSPQRHPRTESFLGTSWKVNKSGITGGNLVAVGNYADAQITGTEADIRGFSWNGSTWSLTGGTQDAATNSVGTDIAGASGELYGMNKFILVSPKVFLQGAYNSGTGLMSDALRTATTLIPTSDPYRTAPYNTSFTHVANANGETVNASLFNNSPNPENDLVDWVYVELRNISSPTQAPVVQTRSVLVQRDGDLVDVDGTSPVYFKNVDAGNFAVSVRHRNHIGLSTNPAVPVGLGLATTTLNFTNLATASLFGTENVNYARVGSINILFGGNANFNTTIRYGGPANDKDFILSNGLSSNPATVLQNVYNSNDLNFNRNVRYGGPGNDKDFILNSPLSSNPANTRNQSLPN